MRNVGGSKLDGENQAQTAMASSQWRKSIVINENLVMAIYHQRQQ